MFSYDEVPYDSYPFPETDPQHLEAIAYLFGLEPVDPRACRVLEIGCSSGFNLIPLAVSSPQSLFFGLDLGASQIERGQAFLSELNVPNIKLHQANILELEKVGLAIFGGEISDSQTFDYIIVHGVLSWVPENVQSAIYSVLSRYLSKNGIAYLSYNTFPGWHTRAILRDILRYRMRQQSAASNPTKAQSNLTEARQILRAFAKALDAKEQSLAIHTREILRSALGLPDWYLFHDLMEEHNYPFYFADVVEKARQHGLDYLGDADLSVMVDFDLPPASQNYLRQLAASDLVSFEQYLDFFKNRMLRRSLFVKAPSAINRANSLEKMRILHAALPFTSENVPDDLPMGEALLTARGVLQTDDPLLQQAFLKLAQAWPNTIPVDDLLRAAGQGVGGAKSVAKKDKSSSGVEAKDRELNLAVNLFRAFMQGFVRLRRKPVLGASCLAGNLPVASPLSRLEAARLSRVTTVWHEHLDLTEFERDIVVLLDGTRRLDNLLNDLGISLDAQVGVEKAIKHFRRRGVF